MAVTVWIALGLWTALILYVMADVRRIMARNSRRNADLLGGEPGPVTVRGVAINRLALVAALFAGNWAILRFGPQLLGAG